MHRFWLVLLCFAASVTLLLGRPALARPRYLGVFVSTYEQNYVASAVSVQTCSICHDRTSGNRLSSNNYAAAMAAVAGASNDRGENDESIRRVLEEVESRPSAIDGLTFGDLIRVGRLPASR